MVVLLMFSPTQIPLRVIYPEEQSCSDLPTLDSWNRSFQCILYMSYQLLTTKWRLQGREEKDRYVCENHVFRTLFKKQKQLPCILFIFSVEF